MASLKRKIKQILINRQYKLYEKTLKAQKMTYNDWIRQQEEKIKINDQIFGKSGNNLTNDLKMPAYDGRKSRNEGNNSKNDELYRQYTFFDSNRIDMGKRTYAIIDNDFLWDVISDFCKEKEADFLFVSLYNGKISEIAHSLICGQFLQNRNTVLVYGDEDIEKNGIRENPWFKPDWSPDRFLSCFYFGGLVAVRRDAFCMAFQSCMKKGVFEDIKKMDNVEKLYVLLYEMLKMQKAFEKGHDKSRLAVCHIPQVLYHSKRNGYDQIRDYRLPGAVIAKIELESRLISIIIPSKDNPDVLFHCLDSLLERTKTKVHFEIILVDNGSSKENRRRIEEKAERLNRKEGPANLTEVRYLYRPMKFNFSGMCNLGAGDAKGDLLFFLNDDMEILEPDWMDLMAGKAYLPYAGAVGAKLLYPESGIIQHAGITNLRVGPAHKLQFLNDEEVLYFGMNRDVHNMLAVTGACLMVRKEVFDQAGGFCEDLAVAFNDVDLCYTIYEQGYYNIVRNDVAFYHHESLSRGKDGESREKQLRLLKEKDILYERHQELYGHDPFYHPYLTTDMLESEYSPAYRYQVTLDMPWSAAEEAAGRVKKARLDQCLVVGMECAMDIYKWQYGVSPEKGTVKVKEDEMGYYFQGYSFVIGSDNACYKKKLLLKHQKSGDIYAISVEDRYRQDIKNNLKDQINVDLTGFAAKMRKKEIPEGVYQFGMLAEDKCSRLKLVNWSSWVLEI